MTDPTAPAEAVPEPEHLDLGAVFPSPSREEWEAQALKVLNRRRPPGKELSIEQAMTRLRSTTVDGIGIEPLYTRTDRDLGYPGAAPFTRGTAVRTGTMEAWDIRQLFEDPDATTTREAILKDLERGVTSVWLRIGSDAINPADLATVLADVMFDLAPVVVSSLEDQNAAAEALTAAWADRGVDPSAVSGNLGIDPLILAAVSGNQPDFGPARAWARKALDSWPAVRALTIDVLPYHDAGASDVDELGLAIASGVALLRDLEQAGIDPATAFGQIEFRVSATTDQFLTIARLRALRRLWARVGEVSGVPEAARGARQHAVTSWRMLSRDDAYVNLLRTTIACFSAATGQAEAITVLPFDTVHGLPNEFSRRMARNIQVILSEESNIGRVNDPSGGSWYVEQVTEQLAASAWEWFQKIEAEGGMSKAVNSQLIKDRLASSITERDRRLADRSMPLTGVSMFPQLTEPTIDRTPRPQAPKSPLIRRRDAEIFEKLRDRAADMGDAKVFLATIGTRRDYGARETFTSSLLHVAGISTPFAEGTDTAAIVEAFRAEQTPVAVLCSSSAQYAEHGVAVAQALREAGATTVLIAGNAKELGEDAPEGTVDGALYAGVESVTLLTSILDTLEEAR